MWDTSTSAPFLRSIVGEEIILPAMTWLTVQVRWTSCHAHGSSAAIGTAPSTPLTQTHTFSRPTSILFLSSLVSRPIPPLLPRHSLVQTLLPPPAMMFHLYSLSLSLLHQEDLLAKNNLLDWFNLNLNKNLSISSLLSCACNFGKKRVLSGFLPFSGRSL